MFRRIVLVTPVYLLVALLIGVNIVGGRLISDSDALFALSRAETAQTISEIHRQSELEGKPTYLKIARLGIELDVNPGIYDEKSQTWTLSNDGAHHAVRTSALKNRFDAGLSLIYGHNFDNIFADLEKLKDGDILEIDTDSGHTFIYRYQDQQIVWPTDTSILDYDGRTKVTLMSCTGNWDEQRLLANFELLAVDENGAM